MYVFFVVSTNKANVHVLKPHILSGEEFFSQLKYTFFGVVDVLKDLLRESVIIAGVIVNS